MRHLTGLILLMVCTVGCATGRSYSPSRRSEPITESVRLECVQFGFVEQDDQQARIYLDVTRNPDDERPYSSFEAGYPIRRMTMETQAFYMRKLRAWLDEAGAPTALVLHTSWQAPGELDPDRILTLHPHPNDQNSDILSIPVENLLAMPAIGAAPDTVHQVEGCVGIPVMVRDRFPADPPVSHFDTEEDSFGQKVAKGIFTLPFKIFFWMVEESVFGDSDDDDDDDNHRARRRPRRAGRRRGLPEANDSACR